MVGDDAAADAMFEALRKGPPLARIDHRVHADNERPPKGFTKRLRRKRLAQPCAIAALPFAEQIETPGRLWYRVPMTKHHPLGDSTAHQPYRFSQRDYVLLAEHGAFDKLAKAELIEGVIVAVNAQYSRHVRVQSLLFRALAEACDRIGGGLGAWVEGSVSIDDDNMPQPDIFVSRGLPDEGPMTLDRLLLVVEVADTSLKIDLETKAKVYAAAGIAEYWVADVERRVIHQMWEPEGEAYAERREVAFGERIEAATTTGLVVAGDRL